MSTVQPPSSRSFQTVHTSLPTIAAAQAQLGRDSYAVADLGLTAAEAAAARRINVLRPAEWSRFGSVAGIQGEIETLLGQVAPTSSFADRRLAAAAIKRDVEAVLGSARADNAWTTVRATTTTPAYDTPRWHIDGNFYAKADGDIPCKFAGVIAGPGTLLARLGAKQREAFGALLRTPPEGRADEMAWRHELAAIVGNAPIQQLMAGQGVFFRVGDLQQGGVHSEPPINGSRLFFSVVTGTRAQIAELASRYRGILV